MLFVSKGLVSAFGRHADLAWVAVRRYEVIFVTVGFLASAVAAAALVILEGETARKKNENRSNIKV